MNNNEEFKTYKIEYEDSCTVYVFATDIDAAIEKFWKEFGGNYPAFEVKSITLLGRGI